MKRLDRITLQLALEMVADGYQDINHRSYYRHPAPSVISKITMHHSNVTFNDDNYADGVTREIDEHGRVAELAKEIKRRWLMSGYRMLSWEDVRVNYDPYETRAGIRRYIRELRNTTRAIDNSIKLNDFIKKLNEEGN